MKKALLLIIGLLLLPLTVFAKDKAVEISDIVIKNISNNTVIINDAEIVEDKIKLDLKMYEVGDFIEYQFTIKNNTDKNYKINPNSFNKIIDNVEYKVTSKDNSFQINKNTSKTFTFKVTYIDEIKEEKTDTNTKVTLDVDRTGLLSSLIDNTEDLTLVSNIAIDSSVTPNPCTYSGSMNQGAEYINGQYTYHYLQEASISGWKNLTSQGWGVRISDATSTEDVTTPLCTSINNKPIVSMSNMFTESQTTSIDTSSFDTSNVTNMYSMFLGCTSLTELDVSGFDTHNVTNMGQMFNACTSLTELDLSSFDTFKVTSIGNMFTGCSGLTKIDLSTFNTSNVTSFGAMFANCSNLTEINISGFDMRKVSSFCSTAGGFFSSTTSLKKINMSNMKLPSDMSNAIFRCGSTLSSPIEEIDVTGWDLRKTTNALGMLGSSGSNGTGGTGLKRIIGLDTWDTSHITNMNSMFMALKSLESVDVSSFDTSNVTDISYMFQDLATIERLDISNFDTSKVTKDYGGFLSGCTNLKSLNLDNLTVNSMPGGLLSGLPSLKTLSVKNWVIPSTFKNGFFRSMSSGSSIEEIDVTGWDLSKTTDITALFAGDEEYGNGTELKRIIGLDTWNTSKITTMKDLFRDLPSLEKLDLSGWDTSNVTDTDTMFVGCTSVTESFARTETDAEKLNASSEKPENVVFIVNTPDESFDADFIIKSVDFVEKEGMAEELEEAYLDKNRIQLNVKMYELEDSITYNFVVENVSGETRILDKDIINDNSPYMEYEIIPEDKSFKMKDGEEKEFTLVATYKNEVDRDLFKANKYNAGKRIPLDFQSIPIIPIINPETGDFFYIFIFIMIVCSVCILSKNKKVKIGLIGISIVLLISPFFVTAEEGEKIPPGIDSNIYIKFIKPNPCTFDGELVQGAEYVNGQYTYRYMQEYGYTYPNYLWENMAKDGWGITLTDKESTDPVTSTICTSINNKPVISMSNMFSESKTTSIDTSSFDTSQVEIFTKMFSRAVNIEELDLSQFDTSNAESLARMFEYVDKLKSLNLENFDTKSVITFDGIFIGSKIQYLNLNGWDFRNKNSDAPSLESDLNFPAQYLECVELNNAYFTEKQMYGAFINQKALKTVYLNNADASLAQTLTLMFSGCDNLNHVELNNFKIPNVTDMSYFYSYCKSIVSLDEVGFFDLDFSNVTNMKYFFAGCESLIEVNAQNLELPKAQDLSYFISDCDSLVSVDLSGTSIPNATNMYDFLYNCDNLKTVNLSGMSSDNLVDMSSALSYNPLLENVNLSHCGGKSLQSISYLFNYCTSIKKIDMSYFNFGTIEFLSTGSDGFIYSTRNSLISLDLSHSDMSMMTDLRDAFRYLYVLESIDLSYINMERVSSIDGLCRDDPKLETMTLENSITSSLTNIRYMFKSDSLLTSFNLEGIDTSHVTDMTYIFDGCSSLESADLSYLSTTSVTSMNYLFGSCSELKSVNLSGLGGTDLVYVSNIFYGCSKLESITMDYFNFGSSNLNHTFYYINVPYEVDLSNSDFTRTSSVYAMFEGEDYNSLLTTANFEGTTMGTTMNAMFYNCKNLEELNLLNMDVSSVTDMNSVFLNSNSIETLDLSGWNTANVTNMTSMFENCSQLETIYVSDNFVTNGLSEQMSMFSNATSLVGGNGTHYNSSHLTQEYARIDEPGSPGYFTRKGTV